MTEVPRLGLFAFPSFPSCPCSCTMSTSRFFDFAAAGADENESTFMVRFGLRALFWSIRSSSSGSSRLGGVFVSSSSLGNGERPRAVCGFSGGYMRLTVLAPFCGSFSTASRQVTTLQQHHLRLLLILVFACIFGSPSVPRGGIALFGQLGMDGLTDVVVLIVFGGCHAYDALLERLEGDGRTLVLS